MAKKRTEQPLVASVLDRLLDDDPTVTREPAPSRGQLMWNLKQAVRRDLENLLNTRVRCLDYPPGLKELERSLVNYGIPDFLGANLAGAPDRAELFARLLQGIIRRFEPRFKSVQVQILDAAESLDRTLRFRIDALLDAEPTPEPVVFDSVLKLATGDFEVKGGGGG